MPNRVADDLERGLGPEYISFKNEFAYIEGHNVISVANKLFGFDGWSSELRNITIDYEEHKNGKYNLGVKSILRVTLKDGSFHEGFGYGSSVNMPNKSQAYDKAHKEAVTDALKRALRLFGESAGNCIYEKSYVENVRNVEAQPLKFEPDQLLRPHELKHYMFDTKINPPNAIALLHAEGSNEPTTVDNEHASSNQSMMDKEITEKQVHVLPNQKEHPGQYDLNQNNILKEGEDFKSLSTSTPLHEPKGASELASGDFDEDTNPFVSGISIATNSMKQFDPAECSLKMTLPDVSRKTKKR